VKKNTAVVLILAVAALFFVLEGCKGPEGPAGVAGKDGVAGKNAGFVYFEGFKDSLKCSKCHVPEGDTTLYVAGRVGEWEESVHGSGSAYSENRSTCAECHTTEGYIQKASNQTVTAPLHPTRPGCFACHSPHAKGDFSLRTAVPVSLTSNITGVTAATFDYGKGNLCVSCHRPRTVSTSANTLLPDPTKTATTDTLKIASSRWYGHYGVQGQMLMGEGGFKFQGYTYTGNSYHSSSSVIKTEGCTICHMADFTPNAAGGKIGGHTMKLAWSEEGSTTVTELKEGCLVSGCHTSASLTKLDYKGKMTEVQKNIDTLKTLLMAKNWLDSLDNIKASSSSVLKIVPASRGGALWNYMLVMHDASLGTHNTNYTIELLRSSIAELRKP
jgi:hypothetical protein